MTANGGLSTVRMLSVTVVSGMPSSMIDRKPLARSLRENLRCSRSRRLFFSHPHIPCARIQIVLTAMVLFPLRMVSARKAPPNCVVGGPCELCAGLELSQSRAATKRRQEYICRALDDEWKMRPVRGDSVSTTKKAKNNDEDDDSSSSRLLLEPPRRSP